MNTFSLNPLDLNPLDLERKLIIPEVLIPKTSIFWITPSETCSQLDNKALSNSDDTQTLINKFTSFTFKKNNSQPPLSELGIKQTSFFGYSIFDYFHKSQIIITNQYFCPSNVACIMSIMLIIEQIYAKKNENENENVYITITNTIIGIEKTQLLDDREFVPVSDENLKIIIKYIRAWFNQNYFEYFAHCDYGLSIDIVNIIKFLSFKISIDTMKKYMGSFLSSFFDDELDIFDYLIMSLDKIKLKINDYNKNHPDFTFTFISRQHFLKVLIFYLKKISIILFYSVNSKRNIIKIQSPKKDFLDKTLNELRDKFNKLNNDEKTKKEELQNKFNNKKKEGFKIYNPLTSTTDRLITELEDIKKNKEIINQEINNMLKQKNNLLQILNTDKKKDEEEAKKEIISSFENEIINMKNEFDPADSIQNIIKKDNSNNSDLLLLDNNFLPGDEKLFDMYIAKLEHYLRLNRFNFIKFKFGHDIKYISPQTKKTANENFTSLISHLNKQSTSKITICMSHSSFLSHIFGYKEDHKICVQSNENKCNKLPLQKYIDPSKLSLIDERLFGSKNNSKDNSKDDFKDTICGLPNQSKNKRLFAIIDKITRIGSNNNLSNDNIHTIFQINETPSFDYTKSLEEDTNKYFKKYLKYKQKYLELQKNKTI
jgi:hypothetical protein